MRKDQSLRFCHCIDSLALFANKKLKMFDEMFEPDSKFLIQKNRHEVLNEVFHDHIEIIDEYVEANEEDLLESYLHEIKNWKNAICDYFLVAEVNEEFAILSCGDFSFKVVGITQNINEVCPKAPAWVDAILLPFEGVITYAMSMSLLNINYSEDATKMLNEEAKKALKGKIIEFGDDFIDIAPKINQHIKERKDKINEENDMFDENKPGKMKISYVEPSEGKHESAIRGLKNKERNNAIDNHLNNIFDNDELLKNWKDEQLKQAVSNFNKHEPIMKFETFINRYGGIPEHEKDITSNINKLEDWLIYAHPVVFDLVKQLSDNNYTLKLDDISKSVVYSIPECIMPFGAGFYYNNDFIFVIFEEYQTALSKINWKEIEEEREINDAIINSCNKLVELCGIVLLDDLYKQFIFWYPCYTTKFDLNQFWNRVKKLIDKAGYACDFVTNVPSVNFEDRYLINAWLLDKYNLLYEDEDLSDDEYEKNSMALDNDISILYERHQFVGFKVFPEFLRDNYYLDYVQTIPEIQEFVEFLDERVPDKADDYEYAEEIVERLVDSCLEDLYNKPDIGQFIEEQNFDFNEDELGEFLNRYMNAVNSIPRWLNYGQSPFDLNNSDDFNKKLYSELSDGRPLNSDASKIAISKKIGRNEPCPCGSGLKYKKCCGRPS